MRALGFLFIFAAILAGIVWPWAQINFLGRDLATLEFGNLKGPVVERQTFSVSEADNPVRIRLQARYIIGAKLPQGPLPVRVVITDLEGTLLTGIISFATRNLDAGTQQSRVQGSQPLNFNIINPGPHQLYLEFAPNPNDGGILDPGLEGITATVIANAPAIRDDYKSLAAVLALAGFYLVVRSRRRGKNETHKSPPRWGRGK